MELKVIKKTKVVTESKHFSNTSLDFWLEKIGRDNAIIDIKVIDSLHYLIFYEFEFEV